ncbi:unnamed protein product [Paramecium pentaurelia]|uniref:Uncharacterized protein n=1 Tax=Paramecium pentaurelia TaxID=43138 RepID=A0A8S1WWN1_9CILI|nr:unnamed protein product [Paramecium pentaurelia]
MQQPSQLQQSSWSNNDENKMQIAIKANIKKDHEKRRNKMNISNLKKD